MTNFQLINILSKLLVKTSIKHQSRTVTNNPIRSCEIRLKNNLFFVIYLDNKEEIKLISNFRNSKINTTLVNRNYHDLLKDLK